MAINRKKTGSEVTKLAAQILNNPDASRIAKSLAGSALSQTNTTNQTGSVMEEKASKVLQSPRYREDTKTLAASVLSQANKGR